MSRPGPTSAQIRQQFLDFFAGKGHTIVRSASLIPHRDPTLLFTNAGMNQFKDVFLGVGSRPYSRVADSQKCMRVSGKHNDLEEVGISPYHHTFFEMLGNWSFGDYYKKEAIEWAWELLTDWWLLPKERLFATVFEDDKGDLDRDDEAADYWVRLTDIAPDHVLYSGRKDNFWEMGETGPCGPCSEIHFDRGPDFCDLKAKPGHICRANGDCRRFLEIWNLVFIQYNRHADGSLDTLPARHVDTGMGFERIVAILQGMRSNYETDLFSGIIARTHELLGDRVRPEPGREDQSQAHLVALRVIADHARAASFLIADGALPGNVGRSYVLRMIIRRAARFGKQLGFEGPFLAQVAERVVDEMGGFYTELIDRRGHILETLTAEEERFQRALDGALAQLGNVLSGLAATRQTVVDGETAFDLYATFGLPLEITRDVAQEQDFRVDEEGFRAASKAHKEASGAGAIGAVDADQLSLYAELLDTLTAAGLVHDPYGEMARHTQVVALVRDGTVTGSAGTGTEVEVVLAATPFCAEAGGQVSDIGTIELAPAAAGQQARAEEGRPGWLIEVSDVRKPIAGLVLHTGRVVRGEPQVGDPVLAAVDVRRRWDIMRNHTATHLLHRELRQVLGQHVLQHGSLVTPERLRFDFSHPTTMRPDQLEAIERQVNQAILQNYPVMAGQSALQDARERGAMALFDEKYGEIVRTIQIGDAHKPYSLELCGGTHVSQTAEIGLFHILSEGSVGANLRRVEAVTGRAAQAQAQAHLSILERAAERLSAAPDEVDSKVSALLDEVQEAHKEVARLRRAAARATFERLMETSASPASPDGVQEAAGVPVLTAVVDNASADSLREIADWFRDRVGSGVAALGTTAGGRPSIIVAVTPDLVERGLQAHALIRPAARLIDGGGGGRPTLAQAGGRDPSRLAEALAAVPRQIVELLDG